MSADRDGAVLDVHAHVIPESLLRAVEGRTDPRFPSSRRTDDAWIIDMPGVGPRPVKDGLTRPERRLHYLDTHGISAQLLSPWLDLQPTESMSAAKARGWAQQINDSLLEVARDRSVGALASVALDDTDAAATDLSAALRRGMRGLILNTSPAHCTDLADPRLEPLWQVAEEQGAPVLLHPPTDGPSRALPGSDEFGNAYCRLVDTSFALAKLILSGVLDRHPGLVLITVHGGGFVPFQALRWDGAHRADRLARYRLQRDRPSDYLRDIYVDTAVMSGAAIGMLIDTVGEDRVLLGTDYPFPLGDPNPVQTVRGLRAGPERERKILGGSLALMLGGMD